jgi:dihydrolipoamide dehydrogenase
MMRGRTSQRVLEFDSAPQPSFDRILETLNAQATAREQQLIRQLEAARVRVMQGTAMFSNARQVEVMSEGGEFATIQADYYVIATGSTPREHPQYRFDGHTIMSSDQLLLKPFPKSIVIIGAGAIGCEVASMLANFGQTKVNMIEKGRRILPLEDDDVAFKIQLLLENKGVRFHHESALRSLNLVDGGVRYTVKNSVTGEMSVLNVEKALVSIGRQPNYASLGLENVPGIRIENGRISKDRFGRVEPYRHIYVAGDASGGAGLVNAAEMQARGCVEHMFSFKPQSGDRFNASNLTTILFLDQEVASVGWNERLCQQNAVAYRMARYGYEFVSRALAMNNTNGFIKIIVTNDHEQRVLGVRAVGPHASSVVEIAALAVHQQKTLVELSELFVAYPAITQGFQECVRMLLGTSTLKPNVFPQLVVHEWSPTLPRGRGYPNTTGNMQ